MGQWYEHQKTYSVGSSITVELRSGKLEHHEFGSAAEASGRAEIIEEALSWIGTPFVDCGDIKGPKGAVDCAMLLCRTFVDTGSAPPFDPRPYSPRIMLHSEKQEFLGWIEKLGGIEVERPKLGDVVVWQYGRSFSHGGVLVNSEDVMHAFSADGMATVTRLDAPMLSFITHKLRRPVRYFDCWRKK